jgi:hypothetical protein
VGSIVEGTDEVRSGEAPELTDRIDESECGGCGRFTQHHGRYRPQNGLASIVDPAAQQQKQNYQGDIVADKDQEPVHQPGGKQRRGGVPTELGLLIEVPAVQ